MNISENNSNNNSKRLKSRSRSNDNEKVSHKSKKVVKSKRLRIKKNKKTSSNQFRERSSSKAKEEISFPLNSEHSNIMEGNLGSSHQVNEFVSNFPQVTEPNNENIVSSDPQAESAPQEQRLIHIRIMPFGLFGNLISNAPEEPETQQTNEAENEAGENESSFNDLFTRLMFLRMLQRNMQEREEQEQQEEARIASRRVPELQLEEEADPTKRCVICLTYKKDHAYIPCGHKAMCGRCASESSVHNEQKCSICKEKFDSICRIYE